MSAPLIHPAFAPPQGPADLFFVAALIGEEYDFEILSPVELVTYGRQAGLGFMYEEIPAGSTTLSDHVRTLIPPHYRETTIDVAETLLSDGDPIVIYAHVDRGSEDVKIAASMKLAEPTAVTAAYVFLSSHRRMVAAHSIARFTRKVSDLMQHSAPAAAESLYSGLLAIHMHLARRRGIAHCLRCVVRAGGTIAVTREHADNSVVLSSSEILRWAAKRGVELRSSRVLLGAEYLEVGHTQPLPADAKVALSARIPLDDSRFETVVFAHANDEPSGRGGVSNAASQSCDGSASVVPFPDGPC